MKGLIIKDFYCLKKQIETLAFILTGIAAVAVMTVLSERFGNLSRAVSESTEIVSIFRISVMLFLILPVICVADISSLFIYDKAASFYKTAASSPLGTEKRVLSKFITALLFLTAGIATDLIMAAVMAGVSDMIAFKECAGAMISIAACVTVYTSLVITLNYAGLTPLYSSVLPIAAGAVLFFAVKIRRIIAALSANDVQSLFRFFSVVIKTIETKPYMFAAGAAAVITGCFFLSVFFAKRRREVA